MDRVKFGTEPKNALFTANCIAFALHFWKDKSTSVAMEYLSDYALK